MQTEDCHLHRVRVKRKYWAKKNACFLFALRDKRSINSNADLLISREPHAVIHATRYF